MKLYVFPFARETQDQAGDLPALQDKIDTLQQAAFATFELKALKEQDFPLFQQLCHLRSQREQWRVADRGRASRTQLAWLQLLCRTEPPFDPNSWPSRIAALVKHL